MTKAEIEKIATEAMIIATNAYRACDKATSKSGGHDMRGPVIREIMRVALTIGRNGEDVREALLKD